MMARLVCRRLTSGRHDVSRLARDKVLSQVAQQDIMSQQQESASERNPGEKERLAAVPCEVASELLYEVGWESRHVYVDVRDAAAFGRGRPKGAINVPFHTDDAFAALVTERVGREPGRVVVGGDAASKAAASLETLGYRPVLLDGDFDRWRSLGLPIDVEGLEDNEDDDDGDPSHWS